MFFGPLRLPSGAYLSWHGSDNSAFLYPETGALAVRLACYHFRAAGFAPFLDRVPPTLSWLSSCIRADGLVHHRGSAWLFDSVLTLQAFREAAQAGIPGDFAQLVPLMEDKTLDMVGSGQAARPAQPARWSTRFGPHLLKSIGLLLTGTDDARATRILKSAARKIISTQDDDGAFGPAGSRPAYLHAHAYAAEGLAMLARYEPQEFREAFEKALAFLKERQLPAGGFPQWEGSNAGPPAADVTAQAARLFLLCDPLDGDRAAARCLSALHKLSGPTGGLLYTSAVPHENSWASMFAAQALQFATRGPTPPGELL